MDIESDTPPQWVLLVKGPDGKEIEAGRFVTDFLARQFAEDYRITDWRITKSMTQESNPEASATLRLSEWFVILDALEEWSYRTEPIGTGAEARMVRAKLPPEAIEAWNRDKDTPPPVRPQT